MAHTIEVSRRTVSGYDPGTGEWLDGNTVEIADHGTDVREYDPDDGFEPVEWAIDQIKRTDANQPSAYPIPDEIHAHAWLGGKYDHPYTNHVEETSVRVTGDYTDEERARIFRAVSIV